MRLVADWKDGHVSDESVLSTAELLLCEVGEREFIKEDPRSITMEVIVLLEEMMSQCVIPADADALIEFLNADSAETRNAWAKFSAYWDTINFEERRAQLRATHPWYQG